MSGPKVIDYRAVERERAEAARRRWLALRGRITAFEDRCVRFGHPECVVAAGTDAGASADDIERQCTALELALARAADDLARRRHEDRTRQVLGGMQHMLDELERREQSAQRAAREARVAPPPTVDYVDRVTRVLAGLQEPDAALDRAGTAVLAEADPARAGLLYADLVDRVAAANRQSERRATQLTELAELRAQVAELADPEPVAVLLEHAARYIADGTDALQPLQRARIAITAELDAAAAVADREFVRRAVAESLTELGYDVADVAVETADTLVHRQSGTHGVRARIRDGALDVHTVRLAAATPDEDRNADDDLCTRLPGLLDAMSRRGVAARVAARTLPGLVAPEQLVLRARPSAAEPTASAAAERRTRAQK